MARNCFISILVLTIFAGSLVAQTPQQAPQAPKESSKWRTIGTAAGAGGGFLLGMAIGFGKFDDAVNSDRKVTTTIVVSTVAGAVGGYFIGRKIDKSRSATVWRMDEIDRSLLRAQQLPPPHVMLREMGD